MAKGFSVPKIGESIYSSDPNDFIARSTENTNMILANGTLANQSITANPTTITVAHGQSVAPSFYAWAKFPDGYVAMANGSERADAHPLDRYFWVEADSTNIYFLFYKGSGANYSVDIQYILLDSPISTATSNSDPQNSTKGIVVVKDGYNALTENDPNNKTIDTRYDTLKYFMSGSTTLTASGSDVETTITHGLSYNPMFFVYADKFSPGTSFSMLPLRYLSFTFYGYLEAWAYGNDKIYIKMKTNSASNTFNLYYKIFKNQLTI